jgi:hypothetical protein
MGELGRFGAQLPHDEAAQREHFPCHRVSFRREQAVSENGAVECTQYVCGTLSANHEGWGVAQARRTSLSTPGDRAARP